MYLAGLICFPKQALFLLYHTEHITSIKTPSRVSNAISNLPRNPCPSSNSLHGLKSCQDSARAQKPGLASPHEPQSPACQPTMGIRKTAEHPRALLRAVHYSQPQQMSQAQTLSSEEPCM